MIPLSRPWIDDEVCHAVERVLRSGQLVHGDECERFEAELAEYLGAEHVLVVSSGTAALHLALLALGIGPGDAVLVPDFTFPATANVVELIGARPVFVDVARDTYNITVDTLLQAVETWRGPERIRAVMPVHEFGCPADMTGIIALANENSWKVVEDAACALGTLHGPRKAGTFGDAGCFSFHPRKSLTTGEGGAIAVSDPTLANRLRQLRSHGMQRGPKGIEFLLAGLNYRLTNFQAAMGRVQLRKLDSWIEARSVLQGNYRASLAGLGLELPAEVTGHSWQTFMTILPEIVDRGTLISRLRECGVESNLGAQALHLQSHYRTRYPAASKDLPVSERLFLHGLALPLYPGMTDTDVATVVNTLAQAL